MHGAAVGIEGPAVRDAFFVRSGTFEADAGEERALEPAAELVATFEVHVGGPRQAVFFGEDGEVAGA